jgi:predicted nucleic-acid-binding protein
LIGLDTNVLVRYLAQDDDTQAPLANRCIETQCSEEHPGFINHIVLCELTWVLKVSYKTPKSSIVQAIRQLLATKQLSVQESPLIWEALKIYEGANVDFADAVIVATNRRHGCNKTVTFDRGAGKLSDVVKLDTSKNEAHD